MEFVCSLAGKESNAFRVCLTVSLLVLQIETEPLAHSDFIPCPVVFFILLKFCHVSFEQVRIRNGGVDVLKVFILEEQKQNYNKNQSVKNYGKQTRVVTQ